MNPTRTLPLLIAAALPLALAACSDPPKAEGPPAPPPTYAGPEFLRGTIGSMATLRGYTPVLVSGYGLIVNLDGTGSADVPPVLRERFLSELGKRGFGSSETGFRDLKPSEVLNSDRTAIVRVEGVIPPGAPKGTFFDLRVEALPETQTTSLANGTLYTTELSIGGIDLTRPGDRPIARGRGPVFLNPFDSDGDAAKAEFNRVGRVMAGGVSTADMPLQLVVTRPSYRMTRMIADRINGRFPPEPGDKGPIAVPKSDTIITIQIPDRFKDSPQRLLDLLSHLYLNPTAEFAATKAQELATVLSNSANTEYADTISYAWEGMGKTIIPILRTYYDSGHTPLRMAALQAGARLGDVPAAEPLFAIASGANGSNSEKATVLLGDMLRQRRDHARVLLQLRELLDADDPWVRMAAFDGLAGVDDTTVERRGFSDKCEVAWVRCRKPMIYVAREGKPRIVIFNDQTAFRTPLMFSLWDGQFMLKQQTGDPKVSVYFRPPGHTRGHQEQIPANLAYLAGVMAFNPDQDSKSVGLDMTYSQIVAVLNRLTNVDRVVDADFILQRSRLEETIAKGRIATPTDLRPDTAPQGPADTPTTDNPTGVSDLDPAPAGERPEAGGEKIIGLPEGARPFAP